MKRGLARPGSHSALPTPAFAGAGSARARPGLQGSIAALGEQARGLCAFLRARLGSFQGRLQAGREPRVARQVEDIVDGIVLAPGHRRLAGKARVGAEHDFHRPPAAHNPAAAPPDGPEPLPEQGRGATRHGPQGPRSPAQSRTHAGPPASLPHAQLDPPRDRRKNTRQNGPPGLSPGRSHPAAARRRPRSSSRPRNRPRHRGPSAVQIASKPGYTLSASGNSSATGQVFVAKELSYM